MTTRQRVHPLVLALAQIRHRAGISQRALAAKVHVSHRSISNWEIGRSEPKVADVAALAEALGYRLTLIKNQETTHDHPQQ